MYNKMISRLRSMGELLKPTYQAYVFASLLVLGAGIVISGWAYAGLNDAVDQNFETTFSREVTSNQDDISEQLTRYSEVLLGGVAVFKASDDVSREEWTQYARVFQSQSMLPGLGALGFSKVVNADQLDMVEEQVHAEGYPDFKIFPRDPSREVYTTIYYIEPFDPANSKAFGYDMFSDPTRREAMVRARDTGQPSITAKVTLLQDQGRATHQAGFLLYIPVYANGSTVDTVEQRRSALVGYVYAPVRAGDLLNGISHIKDKPSIAVAVFDGESTDKNNLIYASKNIDQFATTDSKIHKKQVVLQINGHAWTSVYYANESLAEIPSTQQPAIVLAIGVILSMLLAVLLFGIMNNRAKQEIMAHNAEMLNVKDGLISLASHQLRTPATAVKQYIELVLEGYVGKVPKAQRDMLEKAVKSNDRQLETIDQILYVSRLDAGRLRMQIEPTSIAALVRDIVAEQRPQFAQRKQKISVKLDTKIPDISIDRRYTRMCVENLLSNAAKYTHNGGKVFVVVSKQEDSVRILVRDTGVGIAQQDIGKLFDKFVRLDNDLSVQAGGSGIGLYLVKEIMRLHGGDVAVRSKEGEGTEFELVLPIRGSEQKSL